MAEKNEPDILENNRVNIRETIRETIRGKKRADFRAGRRTNIRSNGVRRHTKKRDAAVSPVIATILLVAIAVGLAAVVAVAAFGMTGNLEGGKIVSLTVSAQKTASGHDIIITYAGGADLPSLTGVFVTADEEPAEPVKTYSFPPSVGTVQKFTAEPGHKRVIVVGAFDGYEQMLYDKTMVIP